MVKGIVLAGGHATRLYPLTKVTNKHLLPVGRLPMIYYPIARLIEGGITDILIVTSRDHMGDIVNLLGSGIDLGVKFTYRVQDTAGGIAQALGLAEAFVGNDSCLVILGDNIFTESFSEAIKDFSENTDGARILLKHVPDPGRYGVAELSDDETVIAIEEKPDNPKSNLAVTGVYFYDSEVFDMIKTLKPSGRGELEITDVNNCYIQKSKMKSSHYNGEWTDAGTFESLLYANNLVKDLEVPEVVKCIMDKS
ncbi:MAG: sugar phosphate nucleotidyltransferase [Planctomycetota bacterium]|jgi:glucose-1-phosphate thymidylyltransferase